MHRLRLLEGRSISARAEEPISGEHRGDLLRVDLRAGGGAVDDCDGGNAGTGRSPRGRRSRRRGDNPEQSAGSISARAEEPPSWGSGGARRGVDLRAGGGAMQQRRPCQTLAGRSPRGRRSLAAARLWGVLGVDLRAGGGAPQCVLSPNTTSGRSPRGRRSPERLALMTAIEGSISARAEEPTWHSRWEVSGRVDLRAGGGACRCGR